MLDLACKLDNIFKTVKRGAESESEFGTHFTNPLQASPPFEMICKMSV